MSYKKQEPEKQEEKTTCGCGCEEHHCECDDNCHCHDEECHCSDDCTCGDDCKCNDEHRCHEGCTCNHEVDLAEEYLAMARVIQADFDNYRKRSIESIKMAKQDGLINAVECILPCIDVFKSAKEIIKDPADLKGIEMIETEMLNSLSKLGVEKIETKNKQFDPKLHHALAVMENKDLPDGQIIEEYKAGYKLGEKIIRYSQVIVNKNKEDK